MSDEIYVIIVIMGKIAVAGVGVGIGYTIGALLDKVSESSNSGMRFVRYFMNTRIGEAVVNTFVVFFKYFRLLNDLLLVAGSLILFYIVFSINNYELSGRIYSNSMYIDWIVYMLFLMLLGYSYYKVRRYKLSVGRYALAIVVGGFFLSYYISGGRVISNRFFTISNRANVVISEHNFFLLCCVLLVLCYIMVRLVIYFYKESIYSKFFLLKEKADAFLENNYSYLTDAESDVDNASEYGYDDRSNKLYVKNKCLSYRGFLVKDNTLDFDENNEMDMKKEIEYAYTLYYFSLPIRPELLEIIKVKKLSNKHCFINVLFKEDNLEQLDSFLEILIKNKFKIYFSFKYTEMRYNNKNLIVYHDVLLLVDDYQKLEFIDYIKTEFVLSNKKRNIETEYHINVLYNINLYFNREIFLNINKKYIKDMGLLHYVHSFIIYEYDESMLDYYVYGYILSKFDSSEQVGNSSWVSRPIWVESPTNNSLDLKDVVNRPEIVELFSRNFVFRK